MICGVVLLAGCGIEPGVSATDAQQSDATFDPSDDPFGWTRFGDEGRVEIGTFTVPIDYTDPSKGTFDLNIARHLAMKPKERIGSLLVNPGGPGFGGSDFAVYAEQIYSETLLEHFDIVVARNALDPHEIKYFVSNAAPGVDHAALTGMRVFRLSRMPARPMVSVRAIRPEAA